MTFDEFDPGDTIYRSIYGLAGQPIATQIVTSPSDPDDGVYYFHNDHTSASLSTSLGSVSAMSDGAGGLVGDIIRFEPFGDYRSGSGAGDITDQGFTGHKHNDDIGLIYMNARYFLPSKSRFISSDTLIPDPANPQAFNRYSYVLNRPVNLLDPSGHCGINPNTGQIDDFDCTPEDFDDMSIEDRRLWIEQFMNQTGTNWFNAISGFLSAFQDLGLAASGSWLSVVDSYILTAIQDGYARSRGFTDSGTYNPATPIWQAFFDLQRDQPLAESELRDLLGLAEQTATDFGVTMAASMGIFPTRQEQFLLNIGNAWRSNMRNPGTFGGHFADALVNDGAFGNCMILCPEVTAMVVDQQLVNALGPGASTSLANYFTDPRSDSTAMYSFVMIIWSFTSQMGSVPPLPDIPWLPPNPIW